MNYYFDSSALVKLFASERNTTDFQDFFISESKSKSQFFSSVLSRVEIFRSLQRQGRDVSQVDEFLKGLNLVRLSDVVIGLSQIIAPGLKSLDAIHLASAVHLKPLELSFVTYDKPLAKAAQEAGLKSLSPGV